MKRLDRAARHAAVIVVVVLVAVFVLAAWVVRHDPVAEVDHSARALMRDSRVAALKPPMRLVSLIGSGYVLLPVTLACSAVLWRRRHEAVAIALPLLGLAAVVALALTKWIINKPRPSLRGYGFPSGHVFGVTVFVVIAVYLLWRFEAPPRWQQAARVGGALFIALVGYSRLYVNAHWLSDVIGGLLVGVAFALGAMLVVDRHPRPSF
jgi:membrane-associated phospholipid phosphatase